MNVLKVVASVPGSSEVLAPGQSHLRIRSAGSFVCLAQEMHEMEAQA